jgi:hypothetical protein
VDTKEGSTTTVANFLIGRNRQFEDFWFDASGTAHGPSQVETVGPTGDGDVIQLTPSSGSNWQTVDEKPVNTTDRNASTGTDQIDTYTFPTRSVSGTPITAGASMAVGVVTAGVNPQFKAVCRISGVNYEHSLTFTAPDTPKFFGAYWSNNPATGIPWTDSEINSAQFGIKFLATGGRVFGYYRTTLVEL